MQLGQGQYVSTELRQEQTLSAQQIQSLKILTAPLLDLGQLISQEMAENPVLEMEKDDREVSLEVAENKLFDEAIKLENSSGGSEVYYQSPEGEARRQNFFDSITTTESFTENIFNQLRLLELSDELLQACITIVGEIDSSGYLKLSNEELETLIGSSTVAKEAVKTVQSLEPAGVAARDLSDRLLIQLKRLDKKDKVTAQIIEHHLEDLAANRLPLICKKLRISMTRLEESLEVIRSLQPTIEGSTANSAEYVQEEILVKEKKGELVVETLNHKLPVLKISKYYKNLMEDQSLSAEDRAFIKSKINDAIEFMKKIHSRQTTIDKIVNIIIRRQRNFFFEGDKALVPLTMTEVAKEIGCHETTVSRAVSGKYMRCRYGVVALRKFFSTSVIPAKSNSDGEDMSGAAVKDKIREIINSEDIYKPFSDNKISKLLDFEGIKVARRTVAKYRESIGIAAASKRKKFK